MTERQTLDRRGLLRASGALLAGGSIAGCAGVLGEGSETATDDAGGTSTAGSNPTATTEATATATSAATATAEGSTGTAAGESIPAPTDPDAYVASPDLLVDGGHMNTWVTEPVSPGGDASEDERDTRNEIGLQLGQGLGFDGTALDLTVRVGLFAWVGIGDYDRATAESEIGEETEPVESRDGFDVYERDAPSRWVALAENALVKAGRAGPESPDVVVDAVLDAATGSADTFQATDDDYSLVLDELPDTPFRYAQTQEPPAETEIGQLNQFEGVVALGSALSWPGDAEGRYRENVRVFEEEADVEALQEHVDLMIENDYFGEETTLETSHDGRVARISGPVSW